MKKFTKILSLALALALVLSTTAFAATTVYYANDFSQYANVTEAVADIAATVSSNSSFIKTASTVIAKKTETSKNLLTSTDYGVTIASSAPTLTTDAAGINWFRFITAENLGDNPKNKATFLTVVPDNTWDYTEKQNETYIVSYDIKVDPEVSDSFPTATVNSVQQTLWTSDSTGSTSAQDVMFSIRTWKPSEVAANANYAYMQMANGYTTDAFFNNEDDVEVLGNNNIINKLYKDRTYRFAASYTYKETLVDEVSTPLGFPHRETVVDGVVYGNSDERGSTAYTTSDNSKLLAFTFGYNVNQGQSIANLKMYTIGNNDAFTVARADSNLATIEDASVAIKFSMPVAPTADFSGVAIDGLTYGEDFVVTDVKDVVNGNEVYSTAKVKFTKALAANTTYNVTFPAALTTEFGKALGEDATISFTTEKVPTYNIALAANEGLSSNGTALTAATIGDKTVYFTATATNDTGRATNGAVLAIGIYEGEALVKYAFAKRDFAENGSSNTFSAAFKVEKGQTAKAFVVGATSNGGALAN